MPLNCADFVRLFKGLSYPLNLYAFVRYYNHIRPIRSFYQSPTYHLPTLDHPLNLTDFIYSLSYTYKALYHLSYFLSLTYFESLS